MHIISQKALRDFWELSLQEFSDFLAIKAIFGSADYVAPFTVFDVGGNKFRIVVVIHYNRQKLYIRHIYTHAEYNAWSKVMRRLKYKRIKRTKL